MAFTHAGHKKVWYSIMQEMMQKLWYTELPRFSKGHKSYHLPWTSKS